MYNNVNFKQTGHRRKSNRKNNVFGMTTAVLFYFLGFTLLTTETALAQQPAEDDFQRVAIAESLEFPMEFEISEDGRVFVIGRCGGFYGWELDGGSQTLTSTLPDVRCDGEDGLIGLALDPNFTVNNYVYLHYTAASGDMNTRVSRFEVNADNSLNLGSENVLLDWRSDISSGHMGGSLQFSPTGDLYITTGDNRGASTYYSPASQATSANTNDLRGKVLRIRPTAGGGYTIPAGNLFSGDSLHRGEIYGMGFRNPFRLNFDSQSGCAYVGNIGPDSSTDSAEGPGGLDEIEELCTAGNYGWPYIIGYNQPYTGFDPTNLVNNAPDNTGATNLPNSIAALWTISHRAIMVGPLYRFDESINNENKLPEYYDGKLIFWDFNNSSFSTIDIDGGETPPTAVDFPINVPAAFGAIDAELDPSTHQLYVLQWGAGCCEHDPLPVGKLYRYDHVGDRDYGENLAFGASASASSQLGGNSAPNAIDGNPATRWESEHSDPQSITVDLLQSYVIGTVSLTWEAAYSSEYIIEGSLDGINWDLLVDVTSGVGGSEIQNISSSAAYRYVRLTGTARATLFGHSLYEIEIYEVEGEPPPPPPLAENAYLNMPTTLDQNFTDVPVLLSETGVFTDTANMILADGIIEYDPNSQLWSDAAVKTRWLSLPTDAKIGWHATQNWSYPEGTVSIKHFELPLDDADPSIRKRLETRLIVMKSNGRVYGVTYRWRDDNSDAELLTITRSDDVEITDVNGNQRVQTWTYPTAECMDCHNSDSSQILGLSTRQLNGDFNYGAGPENQLRHWNDLGMFQPAFANNQITGFDKMAAIDDTTAPLEDRIKSYLDTNCAHCHGTNNGGSQWDSRFNTLLGDMQIVNHETTGIRDYETDYGISDAKVIDPGNAENSILYIRDKSVDPGDRMPPIGRSLEDLVYIDVLKQWIDGLPAGTTPPSTPPPPVEELASAGQPVIASSSEGDNTPNLSVDGDNATAWISTPSNSPWVQIDLGKKYDISEIILTWGGNNYGFDYVIEGFNDDGTWTEILHQDNGVGGTETFAGLSGSYRFIRLRGVEDNTPYVLELPEFEVFGAEVEPVLLSLNSTVLTSTGEDQQVRARAVDGNAETQWVSEYADGQWIEIDLGFEQSIERIVLDWEAEYSRGYTIEGSRDRITWTTIVMDPNASGCLEIYNDLGASYRYVRVTRAPSEFDWGYSLWEFGIYGQVLALPPGTTTEPPPEPTIPTIAVSTFTEGDVVLLAFSASDTNWFVNGGTYQYQLDGGSAVTVTNSNAVNLGTLAAGNHSVEVQLMDGNGQPVGDSTTINFTANGSEVTPPSTGVEPPRQSGELMTVMSSTASSGAGSAALAHDGSAASRWESEHGVDPQYLELDLGENKLVTRVILDWEAAYASSYTIELSVDGTTWETIYSTTSGNGGTDDISLNGQEGRYIRMHGTERVTAFGYSLYEFEVHGITADPNLARINIVTPTSATLGDTDVVNLEVSISDANWFTDGGSYHYYLDGGSAVEVNGNSANLGTLSTGAHTIYVSLVNSDDVEVSLLDSVTFTVNCGDDCASILVFSRTDGFRHDSIPAGIAMIEDLGSQYGYTVTTTEDSNDFTTENLAQYSTIVFMNTTGNVFDANQEAAFRSYIENGGGYIGTHAAADTEHDWDWYTDVLLGTAEFIDHRDGIPMARLEIEQTSDPLMNHIGTEWILADEWYFWKSSPRGVGNVEVLANLDHSSYTSNSTLPPVEDHPIIYKNTVGTGRIFYTAIGHVSSNFSDPNMVEMIRKAIDWTSGD